MQINRITNSPVQRNQNSKQTQPNFEKLIYMRMTAQADGGLKPPISTIRPIISPLIDSFEGTIHTIQRVFQKTHEISLIDIPEETYYGDIANARVSLAAEDMLEKLQALEQKHPESMKVIDDADTPENMLKVIDDTINIAKQ